MLAFQRADLHHVFIALASLVANAPTEASGSIVIMRPDLLLAMKSVAIELTDVVESSDIIFIEFAMYLRSLSTLHTLMLPLLPHQSTNFQELKF